MGNLHFSLGNDFGTLLGSIAQEHLVYNYDTEKCLSTFQDSLGMTREQALKCLSGKDYVIRTNDDHVTVSMCEREEFDTYPTLNMKDQADLWKEQILNEADCMMFAIQNVFRVKHSKLNVEYSFNDLIEIFSDHNEDGRSKIFNNIIDRLDEVRYADGEEANCVRKIEFIKAFEKWKTSVYQKLNVLEFVNDNNLDDVDHEYRVIKNELMDVILFYQTEFDYSNTNKDVDKSPLVNVFEKSKFFHDTPVSDEIFEVNTNQFVNAIWLSPEGIAYGCSGNIIDMLHLEIADWLKDNNKLPNYNTEEYLSIDDYLEKNGWCKIHDDRILFDPYGKDYSCVDKCIPSNNLTDAQVNFIAEYFKNNKMLLFCGYKNTSMSYLTFKNMDDIMRRSLFMY